MFSASLDNDQYPSEDALLLEFQLEQEQADLAAEARGDAIGYAASDEEGWYYEDSDNETSGEDEYTLRMRALWEKLDNETRINEKPNCNYFATNTDRLDDDTNRVNREVHEMNNDYALRNIGEDSPCEPQEQGFKKTYIIHKSNDAIDDDDEISF